MPKAEKQEGVKCTDCHVLHACNYSLAVLQPHRCWHQGQAAHSHALDGNSHTSQALVFLSRCQQLDCLHLSALDGQRAPSGGGGRGGDTNTGEPIVERMHT